MDVFKKKDLLLAAIDHYEFYTSGQKQVLKVLITISIDGIISASSSYIAEQTNLSRANIYKVLLKFTNEGIINKVKSASERNSTYQLNPEKLQRMVQLHQNKKIVEKQKQVIEP